VEFGGLGRNRATRLACLLTAAALFLILMSALSLEASGHID